LNHRYKGRPLLVIPTSMRKGIVIEDHDHEGHFSLSQSTEQSLESPPIVGFHVYVVGTTPERHITPRGAGVWRILDFRFHHACLITKVLVNFTRRSSRTTTQGRKSWRDPVGCRRPPRNTFNTRIQQNLVRATGSVGPIPANFDFIYFRIVFLCNNRFHDMIYANVFFCLAVNVDADNCFRDIM